jgi:hypothetical protein
MSTCRRGPSSRRARLTACRISPPNRRHRRAAGPGAPERHRRFVRSVASIIVGGIALYLFLPRSLSAAPSWRSVRDVDWPHALLALVL